MKKLLILLMIAALTACGTEEEKQSDLPEGVRQVVVKSSMDASRYSYLEVEEADSSLWIAVPQINAAAGDTLYFTRGLMMEDFQSDSLEQRFDKLLFVEDISKTMSQNKSMPGKAEAHSNIPTDKRDISIAKANGGVTVANVYNDKSDLSGQTIKVKGKVVKVNQGIMDRNWIHIQDGTGEEGKHDLLITTTEMAKVGDVITVEGEAVYDKDFGSGYSYSAMVENGKILNKESGEQVSSK